MGLLFGTSIPIYDVPGIGASILIVPLFTFSATSISLLCLLILFTATPAGIERAYLTTVGPIVTPAIEAGILKLFKSKPCLILSVLPPVYPKQNLAFNERYLDLKENVYKKMSEKI